MEPESKPYILNVKGTGYYRVNYDEENWKSLTSFLKESDHHSIHQLNRAQLVDDIMNLARSQKVDYDLGAFHVFLFRFYPGFIQILSKVYPDFILILYRFYHNFILILSRLF